MEKRNFSMDSETNKAFKELKIRPVSEFMSQKLVSITLHGMIKAGMGWRSEPVGRPELAHPQAQRKEYTMSVVDDE